jgi:hypothetical protein
MNVAEEKIKVLKFLADADEETTAKFLDLIYQLENKTGRFSAEELKKFHVTRQKYLAGENKTILLEDAHAYIRTLKQK